MTIHARAAAAGLQRDWEDASSRPQRVDDAVLEAILARLDTSAPEQPFLSGEAGQPVDFSALLTLNGTDETGELILEDGTSLPIPLDRPLIIDAIGYHQLHHAGRTSTLAIAPPRCPHPTGRSWGAAVQIPSLRSPDNTAYGDLATLARSAAALGRAGAQALAISPTHALFPGDPTRFSPYSPSTRLFHNVLLADPALIGAPPTSAAAPDLIDWPEAARERLLHLRTAFDRAPETVRTTVAAFRAECGEALERHARFDALHANTGIGNWRDWPAEYRDPAGDAVHRFAAAHAEDVAFYAFLQWLTDLSLAEAQRSARQHMNIGLIADLAVGMCPGGSHGWSRRDELLTGLTIGAPPDPLGPDGQSWGITALDPFALARTGFRGFIETIRAALAHAGGIRIDHALGLDRLWVIPEGASASDGAYLTMPGPHLKRIVAIEAHRANAIVIAEDLGTVPPGFRDDLAARGMLGMRVLPFERDRTGAFTRPAGWDAEAVAMTGTHDTPTLAGWWTGRDIAWRRSFASVSDDADDIRADERKSLWAAVGGPGDPPADPPLDPILDAVADAPAPLLIVPMEDLAGLAEAPNIPGTVDEHPNWRRRMPASTEALLADPIIGRRTAMLTEKRPG